MRDVTASISVAKEKIGLVLTNRSYFEGIVDLELRELRKTLIAACERVARGEDNQDRN